MSQQIIGLQRVLQNRGAGQAWNNKLIRWSIVHNCQHQTKPYDIELQMVLLSSKRIIRVNGEVKNTQMCSFGYEAKFQISQNLKGFIKQDSLSFQLFINDHSFTKLQQQNKKYQPPKLNLDNSNIWEMGSQQKAPTQNGSHPFKNQFAQKKDIFSPNMNNKTSMNQAQIKKIQNQETNLAPKPSHTEAKVTKIQKLPQKDKPMSTQVKKEDKKGTQSVIKDTQNELMRILMEDKKRRKEEQKLKG